MSVPLWTPYADEALDLRKPAVKREPASPPPARGSPESFRCAASPEALDYTSNPETFQRVASPEQIRCHPSPLPYQQASPEALQYASKPETFQSTVSPGQIRYVISPLYQYASPDRVQYTVSPVPHYQHRYPTPVPQISPASGSTSSRYEDAAYLNQATLSPPDSPPTDKKIFKDSLSENAEFQAFERNALRAMALKNGGSLLGNNPRMRRAVRSTNQNAADDSYKTQRQRNNFAAKQSRDRRKMREIHLALKVTYLGNLVAKLKAELAGRYCDRCQQPCECGK